MIKEKQKRTNKKTLMQVLLEYLRTVLIAFAVAIGITLFLTFQARHEMIKNLYLEKENKYLIDENIAKQITEHKNLEYALSTRNYIICMQVGNLYETAGNFEKAQIAYEEALKKSNGRSYTPYQKLVYVLAQQEKFEETEQLIESLTDTQNKSLIKFKTRAYMILGDKYYSIGKFLHAARNYEKSKYYYDRFSKKDSKIEGAINTRIINSYIEAADIIVKNGYNSDAVRFLKKAEKLDPDNYKIKYKLAIIYTDLDPEKAAEYFEPLLDKMPQDIDYDTYNRAMIKAANIADLEGRSTIGKYYTKSILKIFL